MEANKLKKEAAKIRKDIKAKEDNGRNPIDMSLPIIPPFKGKNEVKLIILGQDPTIKNEFTRKNIQYTLNLNKNNALRTYINSICNSLGVTIENLYSTNLFKYFYKIPPSNTIDVLINHLEPNLDLLKKELDEYKIV